MKTRLLVTFILAGIVGLSQAVQSTLQVSRLYNITSAAQVIDNRSQYAMGCNYYSFSVTSGTGNWAAQLEYSDISNTGPWTPFTGGSPATLVPSVSIGFANGYHGWVRINTTAGTTVSNFSCSRDYFLFTSLSGGSSGDSVTTIQSWPGAVARTVTSKVNDVVSVKDFGALCDGATNDQTAFQAAINALTPQGGRLVIPESTGDCYIAATTGTEALLVTAPISVISLGRSRLVFNVGDTMDWFRIAPSATAPATYGYPASPSYYFMNVEWSGFDMVGATGPGTLAETGRHAINFDTTNNYGWKLDFHHLRFLGTKTGYGFYLNNVVNTNGGIALSSIRDNLFFDGGIYVANGGDTNIIERNEVHGRGTGIYFSQYNGAVRASVSHNNITSNGCAIVFDGGVDSVFSENEIGISSYGTNTCTTATFDIPATNQVQRISIRDNFIGIDQGARPPAVPNLLIGRQGTYVTDVRVEGNTFYSTAGQNAIVNWGSNTYVDKKNKDLFAALNNTPFLATNGSLLIDDTNSRQGLSLPKQNNILWSEDLTNPIWTKTGTGTGSIPIVTLVSSTLPDGSTGLVSRVQLALNGGTTAGDVSLVIQTTSPTLSAPRTTVSSFWAKTNSGTCALIGASTAGSGLFTISPTWAAYQVDYPSYVSSNPSDSLVLELSGTTHAIETQTCDILVTYAQISGTRADYVKTTDAAFPLSYGTPGSSLVGIAQAPGFRDITTTALPACNSTTTDRLTWIDSTQSPAIGRTCMNGPAGQQWYNHLYAQSNPENYVLQSENFNAPVWSLSNGGAGSLPIVTSSSALNPYGVTGGVQEVVLSINSGTTVADYSQIAQTIYNLPNPHTGTTSFWVKGITNGGFKIDNGVSGHGTPFYQYVTPTSTWTKITMPVYVAGTLDGITLYESGDSYTFSTGAHFLIYGEQQSYHAGTYIATANTPIDQSQTWVSTGGFQSLPVAFSTIGPCNAVTAGTIRAVSDSTTVTWGATVTGGGLYYAVVGCNGTNWTVINGGTIPVSASLVGTNSSGQLVAALPTVDSSGVITVHGLQTSDTATGAITLGGATSGAVTQTVQAVAGTWTITWPAAAPTVAGQSLLSDTGGQFYWGGTTVLYRCTVAGTLRVGQLTTVSGDCGTAVDSGLRVN